MRTKNRETRTPVVTAALVTLSIVACSAVIGHTRQASTLQAPMFQVDAAWPTIPNTWLLGEVSSVAAGPQNHIWVLHRPRSLPAEQQDRAAPPVLRFDSSGRLLGSWGGPADGYEWPDREHAIHVDAKGFVWITGNGGWQPPTVEGRNDDMILKFTPEGKLALQIGRRGKSTGNLDTGNVHQPADLFVHSPTNELFVADGYGNQRVVVFDADTGRFKRMWGAFGNAPPAAMTPNPSQSAAPDAEPSQQFGLVHGIEVSNDGIVYVADRTYRRVQTFTLQGRFLREVKVRADSGVASVPAGLAFSPDPAQRFLYVIDSSSARIVFFDRATLTQIGAFGSRGQKPGEFNLLHHMAADGDGSIYTAEVTSRRAQRFLQRAPSRASAEDEFFHSNGARIRYIDQGSGDPVVLAHGYTNAIERNWIETGVLPNLVKDHRVIAFDMRAHGKSDKPHDPGFYGEEMAQDIVRLLDHLGIERAHIVGYSYGGRLTAKLLTTNPNRFITATLVGSSGQRGWTAETERNLEAQARELESSSVPYRSMVLVTTGLDEPTPSEETIHSGSKEIASRNDPLAHAAMLRANRGLSVTDAELSSVRVPTFAIVGTADRAVPGVRALKAAWPELQVVIVDGATHWGDRSILVRPEFTASLRKFIAAHSSAASRK